VYSRDGMTTVVPPTCSGTTLQHCGRS
jgi:hypothetical protein